jgi:Mrp family chromosome partitioning ATPase
LAEYLAGNAGPQDVVQRDLGPHGMGASTTGSVFNLAFLPSGKIGDNASELVANHRIEGLIASLTPYFEWIIVDSPPVLAVTDAVDLARAADGVLLVAREAKTPLSAAQNSLSLFSNSRVLGFVLNAVKDSEHGGHKYYYYYGNDGKTKKGNSSD